MTKAYRSSISVILVAALVGCATPIGRVHSDIGRLHGSFVRTQGKVTHSAGFMGRSLYRLIDPMHPDVGIIVYGTKTAAPTVGDSVTAKGWICQVGIVQTTQVIVLFEDAPSKGRDACDISVAFPSNWSSLLYAIIGRWLAG